ncbi:M15 family metallopeptidase [uncultured Pseudoalteromonas sp.]|uniref:M15 family metallopeptidase n=1 Tax=uncultured Pseudoalteromonas sp. TaxID=114053 RepID=UPI002637726F|nr:M15 family metallopeptidase [uncultured Pseudoalteromonas sp.]
MNQTELKQCATGLSSSHLVELQNHRLHRDIVNDFLALQQRAKEAGIDLTIASSFRDFHRQSAIWNAKFQGLRPVYTLEQQTVDLASLSDTEKCHAIMLYSALPGASRHHFGTDLDIYDTRPIDDDYQLQLTPDEYSPTGPFAKLTAWLDDNLEKYGFYRPYQEYKGGVAPEPWHISHIGVSAKMMQYLSVATLQQSIEQSELSGKQAILAELNTLYERYVLNVNKP